MPGQKFVLEVNPRLPAPLSRLAELAANLRFSWHRPTRKLFESLDPELWKNVSGNPAVFLRCLDQQALDRAAVNPTFLDQYVKALRSLDGYRQSGPAATDAKLEPGDLVAYFCAEYGFHESFPIYSGGLGILAGDHCKTASDLGLSFVAVGLLYRQGYFTQVVDPAGNQQPQYRDFSSEDLPVQPALDAEGKPVRIVVRLAGRDVHARIWRVRAGRIDVVLLDTNVPENGEAEREITYKLYGGDEETRIRQEIVLGIGGVKALRALGLAPTVWHMNEGHAAFLGLELMREQVAAGVPFAAAREAVAAQSVFTTHTPVAAGHDAFTGELVLRYLGEYCGSLGLASDAFLALGAHQRHGRFNMTSLALTLSRRQNGVSRIHGAVSSQICAEAWPEVPPEDNPIGYVTNGVHVPTFLFQRWKDVFDSRFGEEWPARLSDAPYWEHLYSIPDAEYWNVRLGIKASMLRLVRERLQRQCARNNVSEAHCQRQSRFLDPENPRVLTIGFARRFATYKRATLLFRDPRWLEQIVGDPERPVVFIFAGKAHPADEPGRRLIREVHEMANRPEFLGRVLFIEDYDMGLARSLVAGVDVWLNNPVYPLEASGTSGMKAAINGTVNLSVLDGWWAEAYDGQNGWAIPTSAIDDPARRDDEDARSLYEILQDSVVPTYYDRDPQGLPLRWIQRAKRSMATILPAFNTRRMVTDYIGGLYRPAAKHGRRLTADGCAGARELAAWRERVAQAWPGVRLQMASARPERVGFGDRVQLRVAVHLNGLRPEDARVELLLTRVLPDGPHESPPLHSVGPADERVRVRAGHLVATESFRPTGEVDGEGAHVYAIESTPPWCGQLAAEVRAVPRHELLAHPYEVGLMRWL